MRVEQKRLRKRLFQYRWVYVLGLPGLLLMFFFNYLPMRGLLMAFQDYNPHLGLTGSVWVGLKHFQTLFHDAKFYSMLRNTLVISGLNLLTFPAPIIRLPPSRHALIAAERLAICQFFATKYCTGQVLRQRSKAAAKGFQTSKHALSFADTPMKLEIVFLLF